MKWNRINAIFIKQFADTAHNKGIIIQFLAIPIILVLLLLSLPSDQINNRITIVMVMSTTFTGMMPILTIYNIIKEDKMQNTLRVLIMSTVKPIEYLVGTTGYILVVSLINSSIFGLLGGLGGLKLLAFIVVLMMGIATTLVFGSAMAMYSASRTGSGGLIMIVSMLNGILPLLGLFNESIQKYSKYLYTYQINNMLGDIYGGYFNWNRILIVAINFIIFFSLFVLSYKNNRFYE